MAVAPFAVKKLIRPGSSDPAIQVVGAILHVDAGDADSLFDYFAHRSGGIESHFHVKRDGTVEQYRATGFEADANYKANSFLSGGVRKGYVSIETQGLEHGEWTAEQLESIKRLLLWLSKTHGFKLKPAESPFSGGVGYHTMFGSPGAWTPVAKSCPGPERIKQFHLVLVPWMRRGGKVAGVEARTKAEAKRARERLRRLARGGPDVNRVQQARALLRLASNLAQRKGWKKRKENLREALRSLIPKK